MKTKRIALVMLLCTLAAFITDISYAANFYGQCLLSSGGNSSQGDNVVVLTPLDAKCQSNCQARCDQVFSYTFNPYAQINTGSDSAKNGGQELNQDISIDCYSACQKGEEYKGRAFNAFIISCNDPTQDVFQKLCVDKNGNPATGCKDVDFVSADEARYVCFAKTLQGEAAVGAICNQDASYNVVQTGYTAKESDVFDLSLIGGKSQNQLFLCGKKHISVTPIFSDMPNSNVVPASLCDTSKSMDQWYKYDTWFTFDWKNKNSHRYLATLDDPTFNSLKQAPQTYWYETILSDAKLSASYVGWGQKIHSSSILALTFRMAIWFQLLGAVFIHILGVVSQFMM
ncbi:hypothetical protein [Candidatus Bandiella euplotis]|uniref:Transmembrane protein n=1 Tax=Candidatus Bandiella euplotis TaxID=1664265 RepID=A0ABZ0UT59_9RICK|nr:hypothetical protein [Candidatus Bandiella woodruffii]WPX97250.1 hypothetical protein Bandiella_01397 [Candidatus Bandiella woodruffii]